MDKKEKQKLFEHVETKTLIPKRLFEHVETESLIPKRLFEHVETEPLIPKRLFEHVEDTNRTESEILDVSGFFGGEKATFQSSEPSKINTLPGECSKPLKAVETVKAGDSSSIVTGTISCDGRNFDLQLFEIIKKIYDSPDGEQAKISYRFKIWMRKNTFEATVDAAEVANFKWVRCASGGMAIIRRGENQMPFDEYVSEVISESQPQVRIVYNSNGWKKIEGKAVYVYDAGTIGNIFPNISGNKKHTFEFDAERIGTPEVFHQTMGMLDICEDKKLTLPLLIAAHMGGLTTLFEEAGFPLKFVISVIGATNSRKTSLSLCMTKTFNRRQITKPEVNFNATEGGIEKAISQNSDAVVVIDDFMPASTKTKQRVLDTKLEKVLRMYGDREGIERMTDFARNPGAGYYPVRGMGIITGEHIRGVQSSLLRTLVLKINQDSVENANLTYHQRNFKVLNSHLYDFLAYVTENYSDIIWFISQQAETYRRKEFFQFPRHKEMYAELMTTVDVMLRYFKERNFMNYEECGEKYAEWERIIRQVIKENEEDLNRKDWGEILKDVCVAIEECGAMPLPKTEKKDYGNSVFEDEKHFYIRLEPFLKRMKELLKIWNIELPDLSKTEILNKLEEVDLIETKGKVEGKRTLKLPGSKLNRQVFLYIKKARLTDENFNVKK